MRGSGAVPLAVADRLHAFLRSQADAERDRMRFILWAALAALVGLFIAWCHWTPKTAEAVAAKAAAVAATPPAADAAPPPRTNDDASPPPIIELPVPPPPPRKRSWVPANLPDMIAF